ncbi:MAG: NAD-dependent epimerase/dehydratase family protein [Candidatus Omnitrophica bacterium]|nr:NAD-dependent epimerase/dehydratase family protein [Candidatus Omnitrophota bacterium]
MSVKNKTIFMTGGSGFIGSALAGLLVEHNKVIIYDNCRRFSPVLENLLKHKNLTFIKGDVLDLKRLKKSIPKKIDIVIHLAAIAGVSSYYEMPVSTMVTNILGAHNVLSLVSEKPIKRFLNFSTSEVYATHADRLKEEDETIQGRINERRWTYSLSKLAAEKLAYCYYWEKKLPFVSIRPFNIYGPGQIGEGAIQIFITKALKNDSLHVTGKGNQVRAWCYIDDLTQAVFKCFTNEKAAGNVFNIGNEKTAMKTIDLARMVVSLSGSKSKICFKPHIGVDIDLRVPNIDKAKRLLGYAPKVSLKEGLLKTIKWQKEFVQ